MTKRFQADSDFIARRFGGTGGRVVQEDDRDSAVQTVVAALDAVDLTVRDGETICIIGPSGCGKSTLLRVVAGLEQPDSGKVFYDGRDMTDVPPKDRGIGMVFQNYALYPHMESRMNVGFFFALRHREKEIPERVRITAEIMGVGFDELLDRRPKELSGGQQQRVAIARCISRDPSLFLLDEPLSSLDAKLRMRTRVEIKRLLRRFAITTLYVTHDQTEALALGDRIAIMNRGKIDQLGSYRELYDRPANTFVGTFLGSPPMNLLTLRVDQSGTRLQGEGVDLSLLAGTPAEKGRELLVGIRAEDIERQPEGLKEGLRLVVDVIEPLVQERQQLVYGTVGEQQLVARLSAEEPVRRGDTVWMKVAPDRLHLFDPVTRLRLPDAG